MIEPFSEGQSSEGVISFGLSSYGYDIRLADEFKVFNTKVAELIDPKKADPRTFYDFKGEVCVIPPNSFVLARSVEYLRIPREILAICCGKSTYARCGIITNITPFEPEWEGHVTMGISNTTLLPAKIYAGEGIAQVVFFSSEESCSVSYKDRKGKYQGQKGITPSRVS